MEEERDRYISELQQLHTQLSGLASYNSNKFKQPIGTWSASTVNEWVKSLGISQEICKKIEDLNLDGNSLMELQAIQLIPEFPGMLEHIYRLMGAIDAMKN